MRIRLLQETRKLCLEEAEFLEVMLEKMEAAEQQQREQIADWEELSRIKDQLSKVESKLDHAKRCLLFPSVQGYR